MASKYERELRPKAEQYIAALSQCGICGTIGRFFQYHVKIDTDTPLRKTYDPGHPHADQDGNVTYPNIDMVNEFVNAMEAGRSYEANISAMQMSKEMFNTSLRILA